MLEIVLLLVALYCGYYMIKNYKTANQNAAMVLAYCQMLYILTEKSKFKESDYDKLVAEMWDIDSNLLNWQDFDKKWEKICRALKVSVQYTNTNKTNVNEKVVPIIASSMFDNRHIFQNYGERSERMKKITDDIMNDPKYNY